MDSMSGGEPGLDTLADSPVIDEAGIDPQLSKKLHELIRSGELRQAGLEAELQELERTHENDVYAELIFLLSHLRFLPDVARNHWNSINDHRTSMEQRLGSAVDIRVAMASYFMHVEQLLVNPKIIEWQIYERTRSSAYLDELTKLRNYRCFSEFLPQEIARSEQYNAPLSLVMIDVDNFKEFNDRFGHEAGNAALRDIGELLTAHTRRVDVATRYGGEEFGVILPSTPKAATIGVAERIREAIERHSFAVDDGSAKLTVSVGVAVCPADATTADDLVRNADQAMYEAKSSGKNRVRFYGDSLRSFPRIAESLEGSLSTDGLERHPLTTVNLSIGGMLFETPYEVRSGGLLDLRIELQGGRRVIPASGRVVSVDKQSDGNYRVATRTVEMNPGDRWALVESLSQPASPPPPRVRNPSR